MRRCCLARPWTGCTESGGEEPGAAGNNVGEPGGKVPLLSFLQWRLRLSDCICTHHFIATRHPSRGRRHLRLRCLHLTPPSRREAIETGVRADTGTLFGAVFVLSSRNRQCGKYLGSNNPPAGCLCPRVHVFCSCQDSGQFQLRFTTA